MRVLTHGPVEKLHHTPEALEVLQQQHLVDVVAGQPIGGGEKHAVDGDRGHGVTEGVEARAPERGAAVPVVAKAMLRTHLLAALPRRSREALQLVLNSLCVGLARGRDAHI
jgi:hypothetical protein